MVVSFPTSALFLPWGAGPLRSFYTWKWILKQTTCWLLIHLKALGLMRSGVQFFYIAWGWKENVFSTLCKTLVWHMMKQCLLWKSISFLKLIQLLPVISSDGELSVYMKWLHRILQYYISWQWIVLYRAPISQTWVQSLRPERGLWGGGGYLAVQTPPPPVFWGPAVSSEMLHVQLHIEG